MLDEMILSSLGRFVTVEFYKKDGSLRVLNGRLGVTKYLKGGKNNLDPNQYITIYDMVNKGYRAINRSTIRSISIGGARLSA